MIGTLKMRHGDDSVVCTITTNGVVYIETINGVVRQSEIATHNVDSVEDWLAAELKTTGRQVKTIGFCMIAFRFYCSVLKRIVE
jgi:hypothetical protein